MVLEVHRAMQHNGNADVQELRKKEGELRRQLQVGDHRCRRRRCRHAARVAGFGLECLSAASCCLEWYV